MIILVGLIAYTILFPKMAAEDIGAFFAGPWLIVAYFAIGAACFPIDRAFMVTIP